MRLKWIMATGHSTMARLTATRSITPLLAVCLVVASALACEASQPHRRGHSGAFPSFAASGYKAFVVSVPNHLSRWVARHRLRSALVDLQRDYGFLFSIRRQRWTGYHLRFRATVLGQPAVGSIVISTRYATLTVLLPWLAESLIEAGRPGIVRAGTALLERKPQRWRTAP